MFESLSDLFVQSLSSTWYLVFIFSLSLASLFGCDFSSLFIYFLFNVPWYFLSVQDRLIRSYLVFFGIGGVLAELDTPFAKANFRAMQKWWFKAPFYVL